MEVKVADMVVLQADPFEMKPESIKDIKVLMTVIGGQMSSHIGTI
jgi:predicted amidohydrolase YtcJ